MDMENVVKTSQEQAVASWINYLNQLRLDELLKNLNQEDINLSNALSCIDETLDRISNEIVNNGSGRGGTSGMHGFIAEVAECGISNARSLVNGDSPIYEWINDNGPADLARGSTLIQQKFVQSGNHLSLCAIKDHLSKYPDFLKDGGKYQIPEDHYNKIKNLLSIPSEKANMMHTETNDFSLRQWKEVQQTFGDGKLNINDIEPSKLKYKEVQKGTYKDTFQREKNSLKEVSKEKRDLAYSKSKPSFKEGTQATLVSAAIEGGTGFYLAIKEKKKEGKRISEFTADDWKEIGGETAIKTLKGGIRGITIYTLTNYTATPAAVASSMVTASFGIAEQAYLFRKGEISELEFYENSEALCVETTISAMSSFAGQVLIPVPVIGALIGNAVGTTLYSLAKDNLSQKEIDLIQKYLKNINQHEFELQEKYQKYIEQLNFQLEKFLDIMDRAFAPDIRIAFEGSIELARLTGVPYEEILDTPEKIDEYFLG